MNELEDRFQGCLVGLAIGDALGMPVEMMTRDEILAATGGQGVTGYLSPVQRKIGGTRNLPAGGVTDDTILSFAVARSLINCGGFRPVDQAHELVKEYQNSTLGWGRATKNSAQELKDWFDSSGHRGRHANHPAPPPEKPGAACGNGVAMKIAPLALFDGVRYGPLSEELMMETFELGLMTHGDPRASIAALAVADVVTYTGGFPVNGYSPATLRDLIDFRIEGAEKLYRFYRPSAELFSERLKIARQKNGSPESLSESVGTGCFALESVPFAIETYLRNPQDFRTAVLEAVNAGGDADTTASMVGAMVGANVGLSRIPPDLIAGCQASQTALKLGEALAEAAERGK